ncbi:MAG: aminotransferase class IV [Planctomycetota bacterium]
MRDKKHSSGSCDFGEPRKIYLGHQSEVYVNGNWAPEAEAKFHVYDQGIQSGSILFEVTRTFHQKPFRLRDHIQRLWHGLRYTHIECGLSQEQLHDISVEVVERNNHLLGPGEEWWLEHNISPGLMHAHRLPDSPPATVMITVWPLAIGLAGRAKRYRSGISLVVVPTRSTRVDSVDPKVKSRTRLHYRRAGMEAARRELDAWALLLDDQGLITECPGANILLVREGRLLYPEMIDALQGITARQVIEFADSLGIEARAGRLTEWDVYAADEAFVTATSFCMLPVTRFNGAPVGSGTPGPVYLRLLSAWREKVGLDVAAQAEWMAACLAISSGRK